MTRVAILGGRGIGEVHARIFHELGADVCAVLGSTAESARATSEKLASHIGVRPVPFCQLDLLLAERLDAVIICTPPALHFEQLLAAFSHGLACFCEKPLFWPPHPTVQEMEDQLNRLAFHPNRRLFVNTSNAAFIDALPAPSRPIHSFHFHFHTRGPHRGSDIALDLMPHGLSILMRVLGRRNLSGFSSKASNHHYRCNFFYGDCAVSFDFSEGCDVSPALGFTIEGVEYRRIQESRGATYRVYLEDVQKGSRTQLEDPFKTYISRFLRYCRQPGSLDEAEDALENMRLMTQLLLVEQDQGRGRIRV